MVDDRKVTTVSVIACPGGKHLARRILTSFIPSNERRVASPFVGGGSVELELASRGAAVYGYDVDGALVNFWQQIGRHPDALADYLGRYRGRYIRRALWLRLAEQYAEERSPLKRAAIFWLRNIWSYGGGSLSGSQSHVGNNSKFLVNGFASRIDRIRAFYAPNLHVAVGDFRDTLDRHSDDFVFADPPYMGLEITGKYAADLDDDMQVELADRLNRRGRWLLTINDVEATNELYRDRRRYLVSWRYSFQKNEFGYRVGREMIVVSDDLEVPSWAAEHAKE